MKKRVHIAALLTIAVILMIIVFFLFSRVTGKKPFADLREEDIASVTVHLLPPDATLEITDYTELVNALKDVVVYSKDNSYGQYTGQAVIYSITMKDRKEITVNVYNPFIIIDGIGYKTEYEPCERLSRIANELVR